MANNNTKTTLFVEKKIACQPVKITNLNPTKSGVAFYNANQGSRIEDTDTIDFKNDTNSSDHKLRNLKDKNSGLFTVVGTIKWTAEKKTVNVKGTDKTVQEGILADDTFSIPISVWEDNLLSELQEDKLYKLSPVSVRWFFGKRLATTVQTTAEEIDSPPPEINCEAITAKNLQENLSQSYSAYLALPF